jgi:tetratricopeptide (TPR) repeat protein
MAELACAACGTANREGRKFCAGCGRSLLALPRCPGCAAENAPGERFCGECGTPLAVMTTGTPDPRAYTPKHLAEKTGDLGEYLELTREAVELADRTTDAAVRAAVRPDRAFALILTGRLAEALTVADEILGLVKGDATIGDAFLGWSPLVLACLHKGFVTSMGRLADAEGWLHQGQHLAQEHGPPESVGMMQFVNVYYARAKGDDTLVKNAARHAMEAFDRSGAEAHGSLIPWLLGIDHLTHADWDDAAEAVRRYVARDREMRGWRDFEANALSDLARAYLGQGDPGRALETAAEATAVARRQDARCWLCEALLVHAAALRAAKGLAARDEVEALLGEAQALVEETGARRWFPDLHLERAEIARLVEDAAGRERELREAHRLLVEMGATPRAERVARELACEGRNVTPHARESP